MLETFTLSADWVDPLGRILLHSLWQGVLIALLYRALHAAISPARPALRVWVGELCLLACVLLPVLTEFWPAAPLPAAAQAVLPAAPGAPVVAVAASAFAGVDSAGIRSALVALWMAGVLLLGCRAGWRWQRLRGLVQRARPVAADWQQRLAALCREAGLRHPVRWCESAEVEGPVLVGWLRPVILFPLGLSLNLPVAQVELLLVHELAHVRRGDFLFNTLQLLVETLLFFHPAVHWIAAAVRHDRELACDDWVAARRAQRTEYARALLAVAERRQAASPLLLAASGGVLLQRIRRIVGEDVHEARADASLRTLLVAALSVLAVLVGIQRVEPVWSALRLPVSEVLVRSLREVGVEPIRVPAPVLDRAQLARVDWPVLAADGAELAAIVPAPLARAAGIDGARALDLRLAPIAAAIEPPAVALPPDAARADPRAPLEGPLPYYPRRARASGIEGWVDLDYEVGADGRVRDIRVIESQPARVFDAAAIDALRRWRFAAGSDAGERRVQRFDFSLGGAAATHAEDPLECERPTGTRICRAPRT